MEDIYKILSIDGGGIKGLYSAVILSEFEQKYGPVHENFDLICGTSTGGIIALALGAGIPASKIVEFYVQDGPKIFPRTKWFNCLWHNPVTKFLNQLLLMSKYSDANLRQSLDKVFGQRKIKDCKTTVLIPAVNITDGTPYVFKSDHDESLMRDKDCLLVEVALATAAAPTYFPIAEVTGRAEQFVDGGLWANNPSLLGVQEALKYYLGKTHRSLSLLSVATLHENIKFKKQRFKRKSILSWRERLINLMIDSQSRSVENHMNLLTSSNLLDWKYVRIPAAQLSAAEMKMIAIDKASKVSINILQQKGEEMANKYIHSGCLDVILNETQTL